MSAPTKNWAVARLEEFSVAEVMRSGSAVYPDIGGAIMHLAQQDDSRAQYEMLYHLDLHTKEPVALWSRRMTDGVHTIATSRWEDESFLMQDLKLPKENVPGFLRLYLFGNDSAVRGLHKAYKIIKLEGLNGTPTRAEIEDRITAYARHPTARRTITSAEGIGAFVRLVRSLVVR